MSRERLSPQQWARLEAELRKGPLAHGTGLDGLLRRINTYLVRWARRKFRRLRSFKRARRWWHGLLRRQPAMFARWAWMTEF